MEVVEKGETYERNTKSRLYIHPGATAEAASLLTDDLILEILSRLPARSLQRFKCVSVPWRDLITDPANRKKLPQTLAGFLYTTITNNARRHHFAGVSGDGGAAPFEFDPSLPYLQRGEYKDIVQVVDACNGLLLCRCFNKKVSPQAEDHFRFVVCNPATGRWVELPLPPQSLDPANMHHHTAGLAFDPAISSHFHVLCFKQALPGTPITGVNIYSSRKGAWSYRDIGMVDKVVIFYSTKCVSVGGMMYVIGTLGHTFEYVLLGVDMEGKVWTTFRVPSRQIHGTIGSSQGCLHYAVPPEDDKKKILFSERAIWWLKDRDSKELVLKHTASIDSLMIMTGQKYKVAGIHPHCDTIFPVSCGDDTLVSYDMRHQKFGRILNLEKGSAHQFLPYVPLFLESLADADGQ